MNQLIKKIVKALINMKTVASWSANLDLSGFSGWTRVNIENNWVKNSIGMISENLGRQGLATK